MPAPLYLARFRQPCLRRVSSPAPAQLSAIFPTSSPRRTSPWLATRDAVCCHAVLRSHPPIAASAHSPAFGVCVGMLIKETDGAAGKPWGLLPGNEIPSLFHAESKPQKQLSRVFVLNSCYIQYPPCLQAGGLQSRLLGSLTR